MSKKRRSQAGSTKVEGDVVHGDKITAGGDVVGRDKITQNIRQLIVRPWAWLGSFMILAVTLVLAAGLFNIGPLRTLLPTPLAFAPASGGQSLIIVADFEDRSGGKYQGIDPAQYIYEQLVAQARMDGLDVRIERLRQIAADNTVRSLGEAYRATLVLWGWYDALSITPRMERIQELEGEASAGEGRHISLVDPGEIEFSIITDLPSQATYLIFFTLAMDKYINNLDDEALAYFGSALTAIPAGTTNSINPSETYSYRGIIYARKGDYDRAFGEIELAFQFDPNDAKVYVARGLVHYYQGDNDSAIADFDQAIRLKPDYARAYNDRGLVYADRGEFDRTIADYDKAIQLQPDLAPVYYNRGNAYYSQGKYDQAIADYAQTIQLQPDLFWAYYNRGNAYSSQGEHDRAKVDYDEAIRLRPDFAEAYNNRGNAYSSQDEHDRAIVDYDEAIRLRPDFAEAYYNRGLANERKGNTQQAIADYKKVLEVSADQDLRQSAEQRLEELGVE